MKHIYRIICIILTILVWSLIDVAEISGQNRKSDSTLKPVEETEHENQTKRKKQKSTSEKPKAQMQKDSILDVLALPDTVFCRNVTKKNGWFVPVHVISKEVTKHLSGYFRLTEKDKYGIYHHLECMNSNGKLSANQSLGTYVALSGDDVLSESWSSKVAKISQERCVVDPSGRVIREMAYDKNDNLLFTFTPVQISDDTYIGSYTDENGLIANLRKGKDAQNTLVMIKRDSRGYEVEVKLIDENGVNLRNRNDAYIWMYDYDNLGRQVRQWSADENGNPMIDNATNCGTVQQYDPKTGLSMGYYSIGTDFKPLRFSHNQLMDLSQTFVECRYTYDQWGRIKTETYFDENGRPDSTLAGQHQICYERDSMGHITCTYARDLRGNLTQVSDTPGLFYIRRNYDRDGNVVLFALLGSDSCTFINNNSDLAYNISTYDAEGNYVIDKEYTAIDNGRRLKLKYSNTPDTLYGSVKRQVWYEENVTTVMFKNEEGLITARMHYTPQDSLPMIDPRRGYFSYRRVFYNRPKTYSWEYWYRDTEGNLVDPKIDDFAHTYYFRDSLTMLNQSSSWQADGTLRERFSTSLRESETEDNIQRSYNFAGVNARVGNNAGLYYYKNAARINQLGNKYLLIYYNEWGEPSYANTTTRAYCAKRYKQEQYLDENMHPIEDRYKLMDSLPKALVVGVTDSIGYQLGLKDGDVIMRYGDQLYGDSALTVDGLTMIELEEIIKASTKKTIYVMRHQVAQGRSEMLQIMLPKGKMSELGFTYHPICYTERERKRYEQVYGQNVLILEDKAKKAHESEEEIIIFRPIKVDTEYGKPYYQMGIKDPAIILRRRCRDKSWQIGDSVIDFKKLAIEDGPMILDILSTIDGHIETYTFNRNGFYTLECEYNYATVSEKLMNKLLKKASQELK